jgi:hypothetical protein
MSGMLFFLLFCQKFFETKAKAFPFFHQKFDFLSKVCIEGGLGVFESLQLFWCQVPISQNQKLASIYLVL